jgi:hypothetical protein
LSLFGWLGSGVGSWSGFPVYETLAERLLLGEPTGQLVAALTQASAALTDAELEGAARYFCGWEFCQGKPDDAALLPRELRQRLLAHALRSTDGDKIERARAALGARA